MHYITTLTCTMELLRTDNSRLHRHLYNVTIYTTRWLFNPLNPELNPICYLLALLGAPFSPL